MLSDYYKRNAFVKDLMEKEQVMGLIIAFTSIDQMFFNRPAQAMFSLESSEQQIASLESREYDLVDQLIELLNSISTDQTINNNFAFCQLKGDGFKLNLRYKVDRFSLGDYGDSVILFFLDKSASKPSELARLERINKDLEDYAHILSHDLRAPLRGIHALAEWILEDNEKKLDDESKEHLKLLLERADYMDQLIDGVLAYSKLDVQDNKEQVDLNKIVKKVINSIDKPANTTIKVETKLPQLFVNRIHMLQLFQNLIGNAIKYNDKEKIEITVSCEDIGNLFQFKIADNGRGIAERYFAKIFDKFENLDDKMKSSGLGLSIVKKIVHLYGGSIWLESEVGIGSQFHFTLAKNMPT